MKPESSNFWEQLRMIFHELKLKKYAELLITQKYAKVCNKCFLGNFKDLWIIEMKAQLKNYLGGFPVYLGITHDLPWLFVVV